MNKERNIGFQPVRPAGFQPAASFSRMKVFNGENLRWAHRLKAYVPARVRSERAHVEAASISRGPQGRGYRIYFARAVLQRR